MTTALFEILAEPTRRRVLDLLREQERTVGELVGALEMSQPAVSKHLRVLRDAGLVEARVDAQRRIYSLRPEPLADVDAWLEPYRKFWRGKLASLQRHLASEADPSPESAT
jgi:DNA-binding transcriptional ArsR family regulator